MCIDLSSVDCSRRSLIAQIFEDLKAISEASGEVYDFKELFGFLSNKSRNELYQIINFVAGFHYSLSPFSELGGFVESEYDHFKSSLLWKYDIVIRPVKV